MHDDSTDKVWKCSSKCKPLTECEVNTILDFKSDFDRPMCELLPILCLIMYFPVLYFSIQSKTSH